MELVSYGCEIWSYTLREEYEIRVFEKRVLRRIFGSKRKEEIGDWRRLHNGKLHNFYSSPDIRTIGRKSLRWAGPGPNLGAPGPERS
jgi:hypothetical protein